MEKKQFIFAGFGLLSLIIISFSPVVFKSSPKKRDWKGVIKQQDGSSCGVACLQMIFQHYKIFSDVEDIKEHILQEKDGSSFLSLKKYTEGKGLVAKGWQCNYQVLQEIVNPSILWIEETHFAVLDSLNRDSIYIRDPLKGRLIMNKSDFLDKWSGAVLTFDKKP